MISDNIIINYISFIIVLGISLSQLIPSIIDVESFEKRKFKKLIKYGLVRPIGQAAIFFFITSVCFLVAGFNANYQWFWRVLAILFCLFGFICLLVVIYHKLFNPVMPAVSELTQERLKQNIKRRKQKWIFYTSILIAWLYSWQALIT